MSNRAWRPRFSDGLYRHFPTRHVDGPSNAEIDAAFRHMDGVPDVEGVECFSRTTVTLENAAHVKRRLDERGLVCAMVSHGETVARGFPKALWTAPETGMSGATPSTWLSTRSRWRAPSMPRGIYLFTALDGPDYPFQQNFRRARGYTVDALREICDAAGELLVALEYRIHTPKGWSNIGSMAATLDLAFEVGRPNLGAQLEVAHTLLSHENLGQGRVGRRPPGTPPPPASERHAAAHRHRHDIREQPLSGSAWSSSTGCARPTTPDSWASTASGGRSTRR